MRSDGRTQSREEILEAIARCNIEVEKVADYNQPFAWLNALGEADWHAEREILERELVKLPQPICFTPRGRPVAWVLPDGNVVQIPSGPEWADYEDWVSYHLISFCDNITYMVVVPFYLEIASDEQWHEVEKALREMKVCFITTEKLEGVTLEGVETILRGHSHETAFQRSRQL
jgi:hypothetical protein